MIFKHSLKDIFLVGICILNVLGFIYIAYNFENYSLFTLMFFACFFISLYCTNYQCVSHNFIHNQFFVSSKLNFMFSLLNSMAMGLPQTIYYQHHMNHHRFNNDELGDDGLTKDISSLYRYGKDNKEEGILAYSFIGFFRIDLISLAKKNRGERELLLYFEILSVVLFWGVLIFLSSKFFFFFYLPVWYLGQVAALMENYFEHYGAKSGDRKRDSVSCYNKFYNFLWFNNGYHQEHHFSPTTHWTKIATVKKSLPDDRKTISGAHFLNW